MNEHPEMNARNIGEQPEEDRASSPGVFPGNLPESDCPYQDFRLYEIWQMAEGR